MSIADKLTQIAENEQKVYDSGYVSGKNKMWDNITSNGEREYYTRAFYSTDFTGETFPSGVKPIRGCAYLFYDYRGTELPKNIDLSNLAESSVNSTSGGDYSVNSMFSWANNITKIYDMKIPAMARYDRTFAVTRKLKTIEMPIKSRPETQWYLTFQENHELENLTIEGVIGRKGFDISSAKKLSHDSLMSIINALADYSADTSGTTWTVTLGSENIAKLTEEEQLIADMKGWILA